MDNHFKIEDLKNFSIRVGRDVYMIIECDFSKKLPVKVEVTPSEEIKWVSWSLFAKEVSIWIEKRRLIQEKNLKLENG